MKSLTVWRGHSIRPSLPAGTAKKASGSLPHGRQNRLILQKMKNRKFPLVGNSLLYISFLSVAFGRVRPIQGRTLFLFCLYYIKSILSQRIFPCASRYSSST